MVAELQLYAGSLKMDPRVKPEDDEVQGDKLPEEIPVSSTGMTTKTERLGDPAVEPREDVRFPTTYSQTFQAKRRILGNRVRRFTFA
ncbi:hypothetical protein ACFSM5_14355 [Lacibacterium aquatile]|uniref:Uncharacterized protein n=1 Tax=Lacibacterium aquatile TaxID=1168082 RepID=A0ABW5DTB8_9PROT